MSIHFRQTAFERPQKQHPPLQFKLNLHHSRDYLNQNLESQDRMVGIIRKSSKPVKNHKNNHPASNEIRLNNQKGRESSGELRTVTWPEQYKKTRGLSVQHSVCNVQEEDKKDKQSNQNEAQPVNQVQISQNETRELDRPLEEVINSLQGRNSIFQINMSSNHQHQPNMTDQINVNVSPIEVAPIRPNNSVEIAYERAIKKSRQSQQCNQSESSENIFDMFKKKARVNQESQRSASNGSFNIFDNLKSKKKPEQSNASSSDSDQQNIFEKKKVQGNSILKGSAHEKYSLEKILDASFLYRNYLVVTERRYIKKISLDIPELKETTIRMNKIPKDYFFKPDRVQFNKMTNEPNGDSSYPGHQYLCKVNDDRNCFYFQDLRSQQLKNLNGVGCTQIKLEKQSRISPHTQYDHIYQRFYLFSNKQQKILVYSQLSMELLCKLPVQKHVINPNIHFCHINGRHFLMLIGGYIRVQKQIAQGNNHIEIFEVNKWFLSQKSRLIKLIIGRINPIFIINKIKEDHMFLILGGNAIAKIISEGVFDFQFEKDINESTNMTGISINCKEITELFDYEEHTNISNVSVKLADPFCLHSGIVLTLNSNFLLILPGSLNLFQIRIFHKEINIIEARGSIFQSKVEQYQHRELSLKIEREKLIIYSIDNRGIFHISRQEGKKVEKCRCNVY